MATEVRVMVSTLAALKTELVGPDFREVEAQEMVKIWMEATVNHVPDTL